MDEKMELRSEMSQMQVARREAAGALSANYVTLRDQFAMAALTGIMAHCGAMDGYEENAKGSYRQADAMLKARAEREVL